MRVGDAVDDYVCRVWIGSVEEGGELKGTRRALVRL